MYLAERPCSESKKIGADGLGFSKKSLRLSSPDAYVALRGRIGDDRPACRSYDFQAKAPFDVGLVETGKGHIGIHGDKQRVDVFAAVVLIFKARDGLARRSVRSAKIHADDIFGVPGAKRSCWQSNVAVLDGGGCCHPIDHQLVCSA